MIVTYTPGLCVIMQLNKSNQNHPTEADKKHTKKSGEGGRSLAWKPNQLLSESFQMFRKSTKQKI